MNKLAPIALILLLAFGGALWYLANSEFNASIQARISKVGQYYTDKQVIVERVNIDQTRGLGKLFGLKLKDNSTQNTLIEIGSVTFAFQANTINSSIIIIDELMIEDAIFLVQTNNDSSNYQALYQLLNDKLALIEDSRKQKAEAYLQVNHIEIINPKIFLNGKQLSTPTHFKLEPIGANNGLPASIFGTEILRKTIETIKELP